MGKILLQLIIFFMITNVLCSCTKWDRNQVDLRDSTSQPVIANCVVVLPDLQNYWGKNNHVIRKSVDWIQLHVKSRRNIAAVLVVGDLTYCNSESEWLQFKSTFERLERLVPVIYCSGNHDYGKDGLCDDRSTLYNSFVSYSKSNAAFRGSFIKGDYLNSWFEILLGGKSVIVISLEFGPREDAVAWADSLIRENADKDVILLTHAYLYDDKNRFSYKEFGYKQRGTPYQYRFINQGKVNDGQELWDKLVYGNDNVRVVFCGHQTEPVFFGLVKEKNSFDNDVYQYLFNTQELPNGGNGWVQLVEFAEDSIDSRYYTPFLDKWDIIE